MGRSNVRPSLPRPYVREDRYQLFERLHDHLRAEHCQRKSKSRLVEETVYFIKGALILAIRAPYLLVHSSIESPGRIDP